MKCIKAIRATKEAEVGDIIRVDNKTAHNMVGLYWQYVSKSEWKEATRKTEPSSESVEKKPKKKPKKNEN